MDAQEKKVWLEARRSGIGGSDVGAILGVDPHRSQMDVYLSKIGEVSELDSAPIRRGNRQEPVARAFYEEVTGRAVLPAPLMLRDAETPHLFVNLDGMIERRVETPPTGTERGSLELKSPGLRNFSKMRAAGISQSYFLQVQHGLGITGYPFGAFAAFSAELDQMLHFDIPRDDALIARIRVVCVNWYEAYVVRRVPPPEEAVALPADFAIPTGEITALDTPAWQSAVRGYLEAKELSEMAEELKESAKAECLAAMGEFRVVEGAGARAFHTMQAGRKTFDRDKLVAAHPLDREKVAALLERVTQGSRPQAGIEVELAKCELDLAPFHKTGKAFSSFKMYPIRKELGHGE